MICKSLLNIGTYSQFYPLLGNELETHDKQNRSGLILTFDDGPSLHTVAILKLLKKFDVKATFFTIGSQLERHPEIAKQCTSEGHVIGAHSYSHRNLAKLDNKNFVEEITKFESIASAKGISYLKLFRPPFGEIRPNQITLLRERGYRVIMWSKDSFDWKHNSEKMINTLNLKSLSNDILLFHDGQLSGSRFSTLKTLFFILEKCKKNQTPILQL